MRPRKNAYMRVFVLLVAALCLFAVLECYRGTAGVAQENDVARSAVWAIRATCFSTMRRLHHPPVSPS